jgi:iron complex outermembrane receptor protein
VKGDFPDLGFIRKWSWDIYAQFSQSHGYYTENFALADRVNATAGSANAAGCDPTANINGGPTMADLEPGVACVPVDFFSAVANGAFTPAEKAFLYKTEQGSTIYNHYYVEGAASGDLFNLPGGPIGASVGFQLRREEIDDQPPPDVQAGNDYNLTSAGRTKGADSIQEVFGEVRLPLLKDLPFIDNLVFSASGRFSHYKSYGSTGTYKVGLDWAITPWLTLRASQGTGFRAPALYELFLADQTGFLAQISIDPCVNYGTSAVSQNVKKNCASQGLPPNYGGGAQSATILTGGGIGNLKAETSLSRTVGLVFRPKWFGIDLNLSADYYTFDIRNQIQEFGSANIIFQCYNSPNFPNDPFCGLFTRDLNPASPTFQSITTVHDNFVNVARQIDQGLDVTARWRQRLPYDVAMTVDANLAWTFYTNTILLSGSVNNFLGQVGQPPFVGTVNFRFDRGPWTLNYFLNMVGHTSDDRFVSAVDRNYNGLGQAVQFDHHGPFYTTSNIALRRKFGDWSAEFGVQNLFDKSPPPYGAEGFQSRIGEIPLISQYDLIGRTFFIDVERHF